MSEAVSKRQLKLEHEAYAEIYAQHDRRVMACSICDRTERWGGWVKALLAGWAWEWRRGKAVFICPERHGPDA